MGNAAAPAPQHERLGKHDAALAADEVLDLGPRVFAVVRRAPGAGEEILCVTNVTPQTVEVAAPGRDLLTGQSSDALTLGPYGYAWVLR